MTLSQLLAGAMERDGCRNAITEAEPGLGWGGPKLPPEALSLSQYSFRGRGKAGGMSGVDTGLLLGALPPSCWLSQVT